MGNTPTCNTIEQEASCKTKTTELIISIASSPRAPTHGMYSKSVSLHNGLAPNTLCLSSISPVSDPTHATHFSSSSKAISSGLSPKSNSLYQQKRRSSLLNVHNGITGKYICSRLCKITAEFWYANIESLSVSDQLELACSIFFTMIASNHKMKDMMRRAAKTDSNIEDISLKYLNMLGWLIRHLATDGYDVYELLSKLGCIHRSMGIRIVHFSSMLDAIHDTFLYYFDDVYNTQIQHAMDEVFRLAAQIMTGQDWDFGIAQFKDTDLPFIQSLNHCLKSHVGKKYLFAYLAKTWCDEIVMFLKSLYRFKNTIDDTEKFILARYIYQSSISATATFSLNLSYDHRINAMHLVDDLELLYLRRNDEFTVPSDLFAEVERETIELIKMNHWTQFCSWVKKFHSHRLSFKSTV